MSRVGRLFGWMKNICLVGPLSKFLSELGSVSKPRKQQNFAKMLWTLDWLVVGFPSRQEDS